MSAPSTLPALFGRGARAHFVTGLPRDAAGKVLKRELRQAVTSPPFGLNTAPTK